MILFIACASTPVDSKTPEEAEVVLPDVEAASFVAGVNNPYFPLPVGAKWGFEADTDEGFERIDVEVLSDVKDVNGVTTVVVRDTVLVDGELAEDTWDWYAQDTEGNVWYLGEDTCEYENDECVSTEGAWEWGKDGALPGIVMPAVAEVEELPRYEEYYVDHAEDHGQIVSVGEVVSVEAGDFSGCLQSHEGSTLDPELSEEKYWCPGVGLAMETEGETRVELVEFSGVE